MFKGRTVQRAFARVGPGVHTGIISRLEVRPAEPGTGLRFVSPEGGSVPVHIGSVRSLPGSTVLTSETLMVRTPEHLLAALVAHQVTDATLVLDGPEVPILDGSALPWCEALSEVGTVGVPPDAWVVPEVRVEAHGGVATAVPSATLRLEVEVSYADGPAGQASVELPGPFCQRVALARTFAMKRDVERLLASGRGAGATLENTVIWDVTGPVNSLRCADEPVLHKLIDLAGDLALVGRRIAGTIRVCRGSHALHHELVRALTRA